MPNSLKCKIKHLCHNRTITERERDRILKALEHEEKTDTWSIKDVADTLAKHGLIAEQESCEDAISRQAAKRAIEDRFIELQKRHDDKRCETNYCLNTILELPSVNPQKSSWIPVSERLPKDGGDYLVTIAFDTGDKELVREVKKDYFCILSKKWLYENENIIAWMPLPKPYKEEGAE